MSNAVVQSNWIPDTASFGARLALVRWRMGWNLKEAERECHLTQNTWAGYEAGREPRKFIEVVNRIVLRTSVNKVWLMTGEGSPEAIERPRQDSNLRPADYQAAGSLIHVDFRTRQVIAA